MLRHCKFYLLKQNHNNCIIFFSYFNATCFIVFTTNSNMHCAMFKKYYCVISYCKWSPKCAAITGVGVDMSPHCFIKCPNGSASHTASGNKV